MPIYVDTAREAALGQSGSGALYPIVGANGFQFLHPAVEMQSTTSGAVFTAGRQGTANGSVLTSQTVHLTPIRLPSGMVITKIGFVSATTAAG